MKADWLVVAGVVVLRTAVALDWGDMDQYKSRLQPPPVLSGSTVWFTGQDNDGFDIVLSPEMVSRVEGVLEGCGVADDNCYQDVLDAVQSSDLEIDSKLSKRGFGSLISKTVKGSWNIISDITAMLLLNWHMKSEQFDNSAFYLPLGKAQEATKSAEMPTVVHQAGTVTATITPKPHVKSLTGSIAPMVTTASTDANGHKKGDLIASLDEKLAKKIDEVARRMIDCADGQKFDTLQGFRRRNSEISYGQALCASEGVIGMAGNGGPLADLTLMRHDQMGLQLAETATQAKQALVILKDFILAFSPVLGITPELVEPLGIYVLALIIDSMVIDKIPIGAVNVIAPDVAVTYGAMSPRPTPTSSSASPTSSGCPEETQKVLMCGWEDIPSNCEPKLPDRMTKGKREAVCADGQWKGCKCNTPVIFYESNISEAEFQGIQAFYSLFKELKDRPKVRKAKVSCRNHPLSAPRKDAKEGTSVEDAIDTWCRDNDGKEVHSEGFYWRWGVSQRDVSNRSSFWLRAAKTCDTSEHFNRWECKRALVDGMNECDKGSDMHGLAASIGCLDYSIDLSGVTYDDMPPWAEREDGRRFPPPEFAEKKNGKGQGHVPECDKENGARPVADVDLNKAIDAFCQDGKEITGYGKHWENMFNYPPKGEPQSYNDEGLTMHLAMGAETVQNGGPEPYEDMRWCKDYDWKMGKDDCTYALRKLYDICTKDRSKYLNGGEYTYRCVKYKSWPVNMGKS
ncbi:hypothetical protein IQ07DRAFT_649330 [Pyrenochaeta sp. DS3sAY3a]|nr:hypothetical protein IQ07DRAFT_649330 [Pyrenochaeta sp. DS3sAY3a]